MDTKQTDGKKGKPTGPTKEEMKAFIGEMLTEHVEANKETTTSLFTEEAEDSTTSDDSIDNNAIIKTEDAKQTTVDSPKRIGIKQRKESLEEYRQTFLRVPKLEDRKPVFLSRAVRDSLDEIVRKLGERRMSVSGFVENLARHHLETYQMEVEVWKKL